MKNVLKIIAGTLFLPFLFLGIVIAIIKTIIVLFLGLAWKKGDDWHMELMIKADNFMKWLSNGKND